MISPFWFRSMSILNGWWLERLLLAEVSLLKILLADPGLRCASDESERVLRWHIIMAHYLSIYMKPTYKFVVYLQFLFAPLWLPFDCVPVGLHWFAGWDWASLQARPGCARQTATERLDCTRLPPLPVCTRHAALQRFLSPSRLPLNFLSNSFIFQFVYFLIYFLSFNFNSYSNYSQILTSSTSGRSAMPSLRMSNSQCWCFRTCLRMLRTLSNADCLCVLSFALSGEIRWTAPVAGERLFRPLNRRASSQKLGFLVP